MGVVIVVTTMWLALIQQTAVPDKPDFSGSWMLASGEAGSEIPTPIRVLQVIARSDFRGRPMKPFFREITITRELPGGPHTESYVIGVLGGSVSSQRGGTSVRTETPSATWRERALVIKAADRLEVWSLDNRGNLHIEMTTTRSPEGTLRTVELVYRRSAGYVSLGV